LISPLFAVKLSTGITRPAAAMNDETTQTTTRRNSKVLRRGVVPSFMAAAGVTWYVSA
jgi:hypothetical protein